MNFLIRIFTAFATTKTVDQIVASLVSLAKQLNEAEAKHNSVADEISAEIARLNDIRSAALDEAKRAASVAKKLGDLVK